MKRKGFGLVELLIVLAILAVVAMAGAKLMQDQRRRAVATQVVNEYVTDMLILSRAAREYVTATKSTWSANSVNVISFNSLRTGGYLPSSFSARSTGDGTTVMGNPFRIVAIKAATGTDAPLVVGEVGNALAARLEIAGLAADAAGMMSLKREIASAIAAKAVPAATIAGGTTVAVGAGSNGWTKALGAYFSTAPTQAAVAVLVGFPDLEPEGGGGGGDDSGGPMAEYASCGVELGTKFGTSGSCGSRVTVKSWPSCENSGFIVPLPEIGSSLTFGRQHISIDKMITQAEREYCISRCGTNSTCVTSCNRTADNLNSSGTGDTYIENSQISINNVIVESGFCEDRDCVPSTSNLGTYVCSGDSVPIGTRDVLCCTPL